MISSQFLILITFILTSPTKAIPCQETSSPAHPYDFFRQYYICHRDERPPDFNAPIYLLYDVNPSEGFNLRRDVYIRLAVFHRALRKQKGYENTQLVLPGWSQLYHWRSHNLPQVHIPWGQFFDLRSMRRYTKVLETHEFFAEYERWVRQKLGLRKVASIRISEFYQLQHSEDMFENGVFVDKFEQVACSKSAGRRNDAMSTGILSHGNVTVDERLCMMFQGAASLLYSMFERFNTNPVNLPRVIFLSNAETILHNFWGNVDYWKARRSMRFSSRLVQIANQFRLDYFNSTNEWDRVQRPASWTDEKPFRKAHGGNYLCAHIRRADFLFGREKTTPTLLSASIQIKRKLLELGLRKVFIASDCSKAEFHDLKNYLKRFKVVRYTPENAQQMAELLDGGVAIVDQIVCSHARYFIGTYESTFTYRIYEEREILGFPKDLTFNTFCKNEEETNCERNAVWPIHYE
ncbi:GDP-fucose protein O-fucosyltransferase 2 [Uranotaenia lowii]|uniref:GDP-fucose protein O-fucosyltransferase 2 n=1 Tax=Uranotaenia lowii TaxID=190385 RepID=UPI002479960E|nr:GDP-fucose protein O-fucosyltransferase 2 [Uranotaenia lowii]